MSSESWQLLQRMQNWGQQSCFTATALKVQSRATSKDSISRVGAICKRLMTLLEFSVSPDIQSVHPTALQKSSECFGPERPSHTEQQEQQQQQQKQQECSSDVIVFKPCLVMFGRWGPRVFSVQQTSVDAAPFGSDSMGQML